MRRWMMLGLIGLAACVRPPVAIQGEFTPVTVADVQLSTEPGDRVRWGGVIAEVESRTDESCLEIVSKPLDRRARPVHGTDVTFGRFLGCDAAFYDPTIYAPGREVTVVGTVRSVDAGSVGERHYRFPVVAAETVHLWPERVYHQPVYYYSPWVWGYPFYLHGYYGYHHHSGSHGHHHHHHRRH